MTVYIDPLRRWPQVSASRHFGNGKQSSHLACDGDLEELHQFARQIGLKREWFQDRPNLPHYDLMPTRRAAAVKAGAVEVDAKTFVRLCRKAAQ